MRAIREIIDVTSETITISVPKAFQNHRVEIIVLPLDAETAISGREVEWPQDFVARFAGSVPDFPTLPDEGIYERRQAI